ncbi:MAG: arsenate reductase (azurin) small subunit [Proteobacteria bacterium]|nr:arsenate reductase (azurin) small subunit [Pseudomonadota bacterium]
MSAEKETACDHAACLTRRDALLAGGGGIIAGMVAPIGAASAQRASEGVAYPRKRVVRIGELHDGVPLAFTYPLQAQPNFIVKLGAPAQGGVGPDHDIVAFSSLCTHMGGNLRGRYRHDLKAVGPCPFHFSTFDLTRGGVAVHASATQSLPQVVLEIAGDDVFAVRVAGLIYGYRHNLKDGSLAEGAKTPTMRG